MNDFICSDFICTIFFIPLSPWPVITSKSRVTWRIRPGIQTNKRILYKSRIQLLGTERIFVTVYHFFHVSFLSTSSAIMLTNHLRRIKTPLPPLDLLLPTSGLRPPFLGKALRALRLIGRTNWQVGANSWYQWERLYRQLSAIQYTIDHWHHCIGEVTLEL